MIQLNLKRVKLSFLQGIRLSRVDALAQYVTDLNRIYANERCIFLEMIMMNATAFQKPKGCQRVSKSHLGSKLLFLL